MDGNFQSDYYTIANFNDKFSSKSENTALFIMNANIRSFTKNIECFVSNLNAMYRKPDVIVLTETWLNESTCEYATISSYVGFHTHRTGRRWGGVSVFVREGLGGRLIEAASLVSDMESCSVQVTSNNIVFTVIGVHRPPAESVRHFVDYINILIVFCMMNFQIVRVCILQVISMLT